MNSPVRHRARLWSVAAAVVFVVVAGGAWWSVQRGGAGEPPGNTPAFVLDIANQYVALHGPKRSFLPVGYTPQRFYAQEFFKGFVAGPDATMEGPAGRELEIDAFTAGVRFRREHPEEVDAVMSGYGYARVDVEGVWRRGFEVNAFVPASHPDEAWWLESWGDAERAPAAPEAETLTTLFSRAGGVPWQTHLVGYVSPKGRYGHIGGADRELLVVSVVGTPTESTGAGPVAR